MESAAAVATRLQAAPNNGAYVLRELIRQVPLSADGEDENIHITCVEAWEGNLYVGTSAAEILHFVSIPPDPASGDDQPTYILASRTEPAYTNQQLSPYSVPGVEQILLLPQAGKACILCNGTLTFYTLPELSPAFGGKIKQTDCTWVGGIDQNLLDDEDSETTDDAVVIICLKQKLRLIRIGEQARKIRDIEVGSILDVQKRGDLACVADSKAYALLDVVNQQKIDLFPISSSSGQDSDPGSPTGSAPSHANRPPSRSFSARSPVRRPDLRGHERVSSLGAAPKDHNRLRPGRPSTLGPSAASHNNLSPSPTRPKSPRIDTDDKLLPPTPQFETSEPTLPPPKSFLRPHIATPNGNEFLLTTGTSAQDPGVGMFVNLDGDVVRGTIEFSSYPDALVLDGQGLDSSKTPSPGQGLEEGYVLAIVRRSINGKEEQVVEYQRWDVNQGDSQFIKDYLLLPSTSPNESSTEHDGASQHIGLRNAMTPISLTISTLGNSLGLRRLYITDRPETESEADLKRVKDENQLIAQFANVQAKVLLFSQDRVWWLVRNPLVVQLESQLSAANIVTDQGLVVRREAVEKIINTIRGQEASNEFEFLGFNYIRQEASLLLLIDLIAKTEAGVYAFEHDKRATHDALISGEIDPRIILSIVPILADEVIEGPQGIWVPGGLRDTIASFKKTQDPAAMNQDAKGAYGDNLLQVIKHFLFVWRRKKGFGSVADEKQVFHTVDAALLHLLLMLDSNSPRGPATAGSLRSELNDVVDHGVECFDRAVALLEQHKRLYILSRLYQSRKMIGHVLATWKRIVDGEPDAGGELIDGEQDVRKYLTRIKDPVLVKDYGTWLANRNPKLGVQVFAEETSRVKFTPTEAVALLKEKAPGAVKDYLEYLVFGKNHIQYVNDLITFYLDTVMSEVESSEAARSILTESYSTYRALQPPKPTYRQFITDNSLNAEWWNNRLRLLQLIGGSHDAASRYDVDALADRLAPFSNELVPEMIILNGRRGRHVEALRLLTHGLGDYDTAIRYCLLGGSSIFHPSSSSVPESKIPEKGEQAELFAHLLHEFMKIEDEDERMERTAELLDRFSSLFDISQVLSLIPETWPVETLSAFIVHALRRLVRERNETVVVKALSSAQNLRNNADLIEKIEKIGPQWETIKKDSGVA